MISSKHLGTSEILEKILNILGEILNKLGAFLNIWEDLISSDPASPRALCKNSHL